jgi:Zn-dependent protease
MPPEWFFSKKVRRDMTRWKIARLMGIDIYMHWSFLLAPLLVFLSMGRQPESAPAQPGFAAGLVLLLLVYGCVVLHELGHARMARAFGIQTRDITIYLIGGVARLERMSEKPWEEFFIAIAGPAVNVVIALVLMIPLVPLLFANFGLQQFIENTWLWLLCMLCIMNVLLVLFNMLPAFPMDGGRVLRALLSLGMDHLQATEKAAFVGMLMAVLLGVLGVFALFAGNPGLLLVAMFVFVAGQQELAMTRRRYELLREQPIDVLPVDEVPIPRMHAAEPGFSGLAWDVSRRAWVIWQDGRPVSTYGANPK